MTVSGGRVEVEGDERLTKTLHKASDELRDMDAAQEKTGRLILTRARSLAPRESGRLASSLVMASSSGEVTVSTDVEYAAVQEFGWAAHNISAQPYLIGPADDVRPVFVDYYADDARRALAGVRGA